MENAKPHVLHRVDAVAFVENDIIACRTFEIGIDGASVSAAAPHATGTFVRLQCHLDETHWLDADAVLNECKRYGDEWHWRLHFVCVKAPSPSAFDLFLRQRVRPVSTQAPARGSGPRASPGPIRPRESSPAPRPTGPPPRHRSGPAPVASDQELAALYREALDALKTKR
jgi:hypothetical protein